MKKKVGFLVAVEMEAALKKYGEAKEVKNFGGFRVYIYDAGTYELYLMHSGVGEIAAAAGTQILITAFGVDFIINYGVVGGLTPEMALSKVCLIEKVVHYDMDTSAIDHIEPGRYLEFPDVYIPADRGLIDVALSAVPDLKTVICASADKFVDKREEKERLHELYQADICEMESAGVLLTCIRNQVPALFVKIVSDALGEGADSYVNTVLSTSEACLEIVEKIIEKMV